MSNNEVDQWNQLHEVLNSNQNFCIIEMRKAPTLYELIAPEDAVTGFPTMWRSGNEGPEVIVYRPGFYEAYVNLLAARDEYERHMFQIAFGTLLGYDIEDCIKFAANPVDCDCDKCGGHDSPEHQAARHLWVDQGCPHILKREPERFIFGDVQYEGTRPFQTVTVRFPNGNTTPYGRLMHPDPELLKHSPAIQNWSIPA